MTAQSILMTVALPLLSRRLLKVHGKDTATFLQGLTTNDIFRVLGDPKVALERAQLVSPAAIYTAFLNPKGRFMFDAFIYRDTGHQEDQEPSCILDIHESHFDLAKTILKRYKLRSNVTLDDISDSFAVKWSLQLKNPKVEELSKESLRFLDPRLEWLGIRSIEEKSEDSSISSADFIYNQHRLILGVPDSPHDLMTEKSLVLESNLHCLNGVSFSKGCYVGQELTARSHFQGVTRKRLTPFRVLKEPLEYCHESPLRGPLLHKSEQVDLDTNESLLDECGDVKGTVTSFDSSSGLGMAMIRSEHMHTFPLKPLRSNRLFVYPWIPSFWKLDEF